LAVILGFPPTYFSSLDYFPLIPWFGVILIGTAIGHILYIQHPNWRNPSSIFNSPAFATSLRQGYGRQEATAGKQFFILNFAGRHSLLIYLLHQPILLALLFLLLKPPSSY
ncbi:DUF1624 domain-containing protein, partial [Candidatus Peregrinibacteria bacterium]|nr:DUF1624 domain-containing protein [Candidatus Peregrinibacteria bacterium]